MEESDGTIVTSFSDDYISLERVSPYDIIGRAVVVSNSFLQWVKLIVYCQSWDYYLLHVYCLFGGNTAIDCSVDWPL